MSVHPLKPPPDDDLSGFSDLYHDVKSLSDHELQLTIGALRAPPVPYRSVHPVIAQFPSLNDEDYGKLHDDIRNNGQRKAVCMYQGMIWDGRSRYDACLDLGLVPKVWALRRGDPVIYLLQRHRDRFGLPRTAERSDALALLRKLDGEEWKNEAQARRADWIGSARAEFQLQRRSPRPCAVCGISSEYSHAHHSLPLSLQYELGVDEPIQEHDWLCPVHHTLIHKHLSVGLIGSRREGGYDYGYRYPDAEARTRAAAAVSEVFEKARRLFVQIGGVAPAGNWSMLTP